MKLESVNEPNQGSQGPTVLDLALNARELLGIFPKHSWADFGKAGLS
jgi:hypothetical protein